MSNVIDLFPDMDDAVPEDEAAPQPLVIRIVLPEPPQPQTSPALAVAGVLACFLMGLAVTSLLLQ